MITSDKDICFFCTTDEFSKKFVEETEKQAKRQEANVEISSCAK